MKQYFFFITTLFMLFFAGANVFAQKKDSVNMIVISGGVVYKYNKEINSNGDTVYTSTTSRYKYNKGDSIFVKYNDQLKRNDTIFLKNNIMYAGSDSLFKQSGAWYKKSDSLYRIQQKKYKEQRLKLSQQSRRIDSLRVSTNLDRLRTDLQVLQTSTSAKKQNRQKKEISIEINTDKNTTVFIKNLSRKIIIKTTRDNTVKLVTEMYQDEGDENKNIDWEKMLNIDFSKDKNEITIQSAGGNTENMSSQSSTSLSYSQSYTTTTTTTTTTGGAINNKSPLIIYIPANAKLDIENSYNAIEIMDDVKELKAQLCNTSLKTKDVDVININNKYGVITTGNIKDAIMDVVNCKINSGDIDKLVIKSKYSTVTFNNSGVIDIKSTSDQYNIEQAKDVQVTKNFGKMNISMLTNSIIMVGSSADLKVNAINASARLIQIDNKYADLKLPVNLLKNYTINIEGNNTSMLTSSENTYTKINTDSSKNHPANLNRTIGDINKPFTAFKINCTSCAVDLR